MSRWQTRGDLSLLGLWAGLQLASAAIPSAPSWGGALELGAYQSSTLSADANMSKVRIYTVNVSQCWEQGYILVELVSSQAAKQLTNPPVNTTLDPPRPGPRSPPRVSFNTSFTTPASTPLPVPSPDNLPHPVPLLLVNPYGAAPDAMVQGDFEYMLSENTFPADFNAYQAQEAVQSQRLNLSMLGNASVDTWTLGVLADVQLMRQTPLSYLIRASCPNPLQNATAGGEAWACPAQCGSMLNFCSPSGTCTCAPGFGGLACLAPLSTQSDFNNTMKTLDPGEWAHFRFEIPEPGANVLLEVLRSTGDTVLFMKREGEGFIPKGLPTLYDYEKFSDTQPFREAQVYHHILWENAEPGIAYASIYNAAEETATFNMTLRIDTDGPSTNRVKLCPMNCSYPRGQCVSNGSTSGTVCDCNPGYAGPYCQGLLLSVNLDTTMKGDVMPLSTVYFMPSTTPSGNLTVSITYRGGLLFLMFNSEGEVPTLSSPGSEQLPVMARNIPLEAVLHIGNISDAYSVIVGLFNADLYDATTIHIRFSKEDDWSPSFVNSPYMIIIIALIGVLFLSLIAVAFRHVGLAVLERAFPPSRPPVILTGDALALSVGAVGPLVPPRGVPKEVVESFPLVEFHEHDSFFAQSSQQQCAVCLGDYEEGESLRKLPLCQHVFHQGCVELWLSRHDTCPLCRCSLQDLVPRRTAPQQERQARTRDPESGEETESLGERISGEQQDGERSRDRTLTQILVPSHQPVMESRASGSPDRGVRDAANVVEVEEPREEGDVQLVSRGGDVSIELRRRESDRLSEDSSRLKSREDGQSSSVVSLFKEDEDVSHRLVQRNTSIVNQSSRM